MWSVRSYCGQRAAADNARRAAPATWPGCLSRRMAGLAASDARLLARPGTCRRLVRTRLLARAVGLVGRRLVLGRGAGRHRGLLPAPEPWPALVAARGCAVAGAADRARTLAPAAPQPLVALSLGIEPNSAHAQEVLPSLLGPKRRQPPRDAGGRAHRHSLRAARPRPLLVATDAGRGGRFPERARRLERHLARFAAEAAVRRAQWRGRGRDVRRHSREKRARRRGAAGGHNRPWSHHASDRRCRGRSPGRSARLALEPRPRPRSAGG